MSANESVPAAATLGGQQRGRVGQERTGGGDDHRPSPATWTPSPVPTTCDCKPGVRCENCRRRGFAVRRMLGIPARLHGEVRRLTHPVEWADTQASYHDARAALCLAKGVPLDLIDPVTGHDLSRHRNEGEQR